MGSKLWSSWKAHLRTYYLGCTSNRRGFSLEGKKKKELHTRSSTRYRKLFFVTLPLKKGSVNISTFHHAFHHSLGGGVKATIQIWRRRTMLASGGHPSPRQLGRGGQRIFRVKRFLFVTEQHLWGGFPFISSIRLVSFRSGFRAGGGQRRLAAEEGS